MNKTMQTFLREVCLKYNIPYPAGMSRWNIQAYIEKHLRKAGLSEYDIRKEFSSDWEVLIL